MYDSIILDLYVFIEKNMLHKNRVYKDRVFTFKDNLDCKFTDLYKPVIEK